ncbi:MAG TPA: YoaK family protein [Dongiaceae bacterium]|nr:YoaK family protein [Dongiaceae bacterium]
MGNESGSGGFFLRIAMIDERHGPLPVLLLGLTLLTGMIDAISYLRLGHVFVANMTGNVVFLGFAAAGVTDFSVPASLTAIGAFLVGAYAGGLAGRRQASHRGRLFWLAMLLECILMAAAWILNILGPQLEPAVSHYGLIILLGLMMGAQNAVVRRLAVPDLTTTVLTLTLTGLAADLPPPAGSRMRRIASVIAMFAGALIGGLLVLRAETGIALAVAFFLLVAIAVVAHAGRSSNHAWTSFR